MNRPPATSRFFMVTLHHVQRRSGMSVCCVAIEDDLSACWSAMAGILAKAARLCQ